MNNQKEFKQVIQTINNATKIIFDRKVYEFLKEKNIMPFFIFKSDRGGTAYRYGLNIKFNKSLAEYEATKENK